MRTRLPTTRASITHKFKIYGTQGPIKGFLTVGLYDDGTPGEIFITMDTVDPALRGMSASFCVALSLCLQYGVPLADIVRKFSRWRFDPSGFTDNPAIGAALSLTDYIARWLEHQFLAGSADPTAPAHSSPGVVTAPKDTAPAINPTTQEATTPDTIAV